MLVGFVQKRVPPDWELRIIPPPFAGKSVVLNEAKESEEALVDVPLDHDVEVEDVLSPGARVAVSTVVIQTPSCLIVDWGEAVEVCICDELQLDDAEVEYDPHVGSGFNVDFGVYYEPVFQGFDHVKEDDVIASGNVKVEGKF